MNEDPVEEKISKASEEVPEIYSVSFDTGKNRFSRRKFIKAAAATAAAAALASCKPKKLALAPTPTKEPIPTKTQSPTRTPTRTRTPTKTLVPTKTRTPTRTYTPTPKSIVITTQNETTNLRTGPGTGYPVIGGLTANTKLNIIGRLDDNSWVNVRVDINDMPSVRNRSLKDVNGWIRTDLLDLKGLPIDDLPVVVPPATATPLPNKSIPPGSEGIQYDFTDLYGNVQHFTLPCGAPIPAGAICTCNCVTTCSCVGYVAPTICVCDAQGGSTTICTCDLVTYWYPN